MLGLDTNPRAVVGGNFPPPDVPVLSEPGKAARTIRLVAHMIEGAFDLPQGTVLEPGRGNASKQLAVHIFVYVLLRVFNLPVVTTARRIARDRGHMRKNADALEERAGASDAVSTALTRFGELAVDYVDAANGIADKRVRYTPKAHA